MATPPFSALQSLGLDYLRKDILTCVKTVRKTLFKTIAIGKRDGIQLQIQQRQLGRTARVRGSVDGQLPMEISGVGGFLLNWLDRILTKGRPWMGPMMRPRQEEGSEELD